VFVPSRNAYVLGDTVIQKPAVMAADGAVWGNMLKQATLVSEEVAAQKAEEERVRAEQQAEISRQQEEIRLAQEAQYRREVELLEREKAATALVERERLADLRDLGVDADMYYQQHRLHETVSTPLASYEDSEWPMVLGFVKEKIERIRAHDAEVKERRLKYEEEERARSEAQGVINERVAKLKAAGWEDNSPASGVGINFTRYVDGKALVSARILLAQTILEMTPHDFEEAVKDGISEQERRKAEEHKRSAEAAERQRAEEDARRLREAALAAQEPVGKSDLELFEDWIGGIRMDAPKLDSAQADHGVRTILKYIDGISPGIIESLTQK